MASLAALVERAESTRRESRHARDEMHRLSHESLLVARQITERSREAREALGRSEALRNEGPRWPAWAPPNVDELRLTLVPLE